MPDSDPKSSIDASAISLRDRLIEVVPRERSGARMTNRVNYQNHWAVAKILELHDSGTSYCVVFEHHDDIVILDREDEPTSAEFVQVKTKEHGTWKLTELLRSRSDDAEGMSIAGKMYVNKKNFPSNTRKLVFVSNVPFVAKLAAGGEAGDQAETCAEELTAEDKHAIIERLRKEHNIDVPEEDVQLFYLVHSDLALRGTEDHGAGKLELVLSRLFPYRRLSYRAIYRALHGEVSRRSGHEDAPHSYAVLLKERAIGRSTVERCLQIAGVHDDPDATWSTVKAFLIDAGWGLGAIQRTSGLWSRYELERMDPEKVALQKLRDRVAGFVRPFSQRDDVAIAEVIAQVEDRVLAAQGDDVELFGIHYIRTMILFEWMKTYDNELPPTDSPTTEEAA